MLKSRNVLLLETVFVGIHVLWMATCDRQFGVYAYSMKYVMLSYQ